MVGSAPFVSVHDASCPLLLKLVNVMDEQLGGGVLVGVDVLVDVGLAVGVDVLVAVAVGVLVLFGV